MSGIMMSLMNSVPPATAGPEVVTANLQLYLDAADPASYPGTGSTWTDLSPNAYSTTIVGTPNYFSTYFNFPGVFAQYVDTNQSLAFESFSVGAWFRTTSPEVKMILSKETTAGTPWNYRLWLNGGILIADIAQGATQSSLNSGVITNYNNGSWYLAMFTRDDSSWYLYVNGGQVTTKADTFTGSITNAQELWVGRSAYTLGGTSPTGSYQWNGDIGQVFVYDRVLSAEEILQNYNATKGTYGL